MPKYVTGPGSTASRAAQAAKRSVSHAPSLPPPSQVFSLPGKLNPPPRQTAAQRSVSQGIDRAVSRAQHGKSALTPAQSRSMLARGVPFYDPNPNKPSVSQLELGLRDEARRRLTPWVDGNRPQAQLRPAQSKVQVWVPPQGKKVVAAPGGGGMVAPIVPGHYEMRPYQPIPISAEARRMAQELGWDPTSQAQAKEAGYHENPVLRTIEHATRLGLGNISGRSSVQHLAIAAALMTPLGRPLAGARGLAAGIRALGDTGEFYGPARAAFNAPGPIARAIGRGGDWVNPLERIPANRADAVQTALARADRPNYMSHPKRLEYQALANEFAGTGKGKKSAQAAMDRFDAVNRKKARQLGIAPSDYLDRANQGASRPIPGLTRGPNTATVEGRKQLWENLRRVEGGDLYDPNLGRVKTPKVFRTLNQNAYRPGTRVQITGHVTPEQETRRVLAISHPDQLLHDASFYEHLHPQFEQELHKDAIKFLRSWVPSQANTSPAGGFNVVMRVLDRIEQGKPVTSEGIGQVAKIVELAARSKRIDAGMAAKLHDFGDSIEGYGTRTWMGHFPHAGAPHAGDVHMIRAGGGVDAKIENRLLNPKEGSMFNTPVTNYTREFAGSPGVHQYERLLEGGQAVADHWNRIGFLGKRDWTLEQTQALRWAAIQRLHGIEPQDVAHMFRTNVRTVSVPGAKIGELRSAVKAEGGTVRSVRRGVVEVYMAPEAASRLGQRLSDEHGFARVMWLSNENAARHREITMDSLPSDQLVTRMSELGFDHLHPSGDGVTFVGRNKIVPKRKFDQAMTAVRAEDPQASGGPVQVEDYGRQTAGSPGFLGRADTAAGRGGARLGGPGAGAAFFPEVRGAFGRIFREERGALGAGEQAGEEALGPLHNRPQTLAEHSAEQMRGALPSAGSTRARQNLGYKEQWAKRFNEYDRIYAEEIAKGTPARDASEIASRALAGELTKIKYQGMKHFSDEEINSLVAQAHASPELSTPQKKRVADTINGAVEGVTPQPAQIALLRKVFDNETITELEQFAKVSDERTFLQKAISEITAAPRTLQSTADVSYLLRQALVAGARHPVLWSRNIVPSLRASGKAGYREAQGLLGLHPDFEDATKHGLAMMEVGQGGKAEEAYMGHYLTKVPGISHAGNAYTYFLNKMRLDMWSLLKDEVAQSAEAGGRDTNKALDDLARYINGTTGRGTGGPRKSGRAFEAVAPTAANLFFSPRLLKSRFDMLNPAYYVHLDPRVRREAIRAAGQTLAAGMVVLGAASQIPGVKVGTDPTSATFGRINIGNTHIDLWGGFQPIVRFYAQLASGVYTTTAGRRFNLAKGGFGSSTRWDILQNFLRSKYAPVPGFIADWMDKTDVTGQKFQWRNQWQKFIPMVWGDLHDVYAQTRKSGASVPESVAAAVGGFALSETGVGVQAYGPRNHVSVGQKISNLTSDSMKYLHEKPSPEVLQEQKDMVALDQKLAGATNPRQRLEITAKFYDQLYINNYNGKPYGQYMNDSALSVGAVKRNYDHLRSMMSRDLEHLHARIHHEEDKQVAK